MKSRFRIMLVGGGTGGHFYPLISIAEALNATQAPPVLYYIGPEPFDAPVLERHGITFVYCPSGKLRRYFSFNNFIDIFKVAGGFFVALVKLFVIYPDVVVSKGGHTSVPVLAAAWFLRIPVIVHESDAVPGRANKFGARFARHVAVSYEATGAHFKNAHNVVFTGIPIRRELIGMADGNERTHLGINSDLPIILIIGGSLGAERINNLILESLNKLLPRYEVIHQTGRDHFEVITNSVVRLITDEALLEHYHPVAFLDGATLNRALHAASLVISRAGSNSIHEIAIHGKPAILIPIPESISHDQRTNAYTYARASNATVMEEHNLTVGLLVPEIERIMQNQDIYQSMVDGAGTFAIRNASETIASLIMNTAVEH